MQVLYVCLDYGVVLGGVRGSAIHVADMVHAFRAEGCQVTVLGRRFVTDGQARFDLDADRVVQAPGRSGLRWFPRLPVRRELLELRARPALRAAVRGLIAETEPDLVYERHALWHDAGVAEAARAGVPSVLEVNASLTDEARDHRRRLRLSAVAERREVASWLTADLVVTNSSGTADVVRSRGQSEVVVSPNAVDPTLFTPRPAAGARLRRELGLDDRFVVGFAGNLKPWHDPNVLVDAVGRLGPEHRASLLIVGGGPEKEPLERHAAANGVDARFVGEVARTEVPDHLAAMDVCVASMIADEPTRSPIKALEYLACGRPCIAARSGDLALIIDRGAAMGYEPGDGTDLAARLAELADDPERRRALAAEGLRQSADRTWRRAARLVLDHVGRARPLAT